MRANRAVPPLLCLALLPASVPAARAAAPPELQEVLPVLSRVQGLSVALRTFENDGRTSLGISYDYAQDVDLVRTAGWAHGRLATAGNIAFRSRLNPDDFLVTRLGIGLRKTLGGRAANAPEAAAALQKAALQAATLETAEQVDAFLASEAVRRYLDFLRPQLELDWSVGGGLESDQRFTRKQWVVGTGLTTELDLWGRAGRVNVFDYPFALFRYLAGTGPFEPLGSSVPTLVIGLDLVSPRGGDPRSALLGRRDSYLRARTEVGFRTELARNGSRVVHASAAWRVYQELGAEAAVTGAGLDRSSYVVATLSSSAGVFISYTDGRLPMDAENDQTYALGWEFAW